MPRNLVNIDLKDYSIEISTVKSDVFSIGDVIYFTNVLPGERLEAKHGFSLDRDFVTQQVFEEIVKYVESNGAKVVFNESAESAWKNVEAANRDLERSMTTGASIKKSKKGRRSVTPDFKRHLKPFQVPAVAHMTEVGHAANFSVPGSGKTTVALATFARLKRKGIVEKLVVVAPRSAFAPWESEFKTCLGEGPKVERITGSRPERKQAWMRADKADLVLLNYHIAANDRVKLGDILSDRACMLLLDESHHIKSIKEGIWATAVKRVAPLATKRVIMTGTPTPNSLLDLWSQFTFLYPSEAVLGSREQFVAEAAPDSDHVREQIRRRLAPLFWRTKKKDLGLPRPKLRRIFVEQGEIQKAIYSALGAKLLREVVQAPSEVEVLRAWRRARLIRLLQAASNPTLLAKYSNEFKLPPLSASGLPVTELIGRYPEFETPSKILRAVTLINTIVKERRKVVVWTSFVHNIHMLLKLLEPIAPLPLYGGIPLSEREDKELNRELIIDRFCNDRKSMVLVANPAACAESISLHMACRDAIYLDRTFNCAHYLQSKDRIHRVGLKSTDEVNYYLLIGRNSIDEVVDDRLTEKERRMIRLLESDFSNVDLELPEDTISEEDEENQDFVETLKHLSETLGDDNQP